MDQFCQLVQNEEHFRELLMACEPQKRANMYNSVRSRLRFRVGTLEAIIAEGKRIAEAKQLPTLDEKTGALIPFKVPEVGEKKLEEVATQAISKTFYESNAKIRLHVVCGKCTADALFYGLPGETRVDVVLKARRKGWKWQKSEVDGEGIELCPKCAAPKPN